MIVLKLGNLFARLIILLCCFCSGFAYAGYECSPSGDSVINDWGHLELLSNSQGETIQFVDSVPVSSYQVENRSGDEIDDYRLEEVGVVVCDQNDSFVKTISISPTSSNRHKDTVTPTFFSGAGAYKLNYFAKYKVYTHVSGEGTMCCGESWHYSTGTATLYSYNVPTISLSPNSSTVDLGSAKNITVTVNDSAGKLDGDLQLTVPSGWSATRQSCQNNTPTLLRCIYRIIHPNQVNSIGSHGITARTTDKMGIQASKSGTITVQEPNSPPEIFSYSLSETTIAPGGQVALTTKARDSNIDTAKRINSIRWCYATRNNTNSCTQIIKDDQNSSDNCKLISNGSSAECDYSTIFNTAGDFYLWVEASDGLDTSKSSTTKLTVDAPPSAVEIKITGALALGNQITLTGEATDSNLNSLKLCYSARGVSTDSCVTQLKVCMASPCEVDVTLSNYSVNDNHQFYVVASDGFNPPVSHAREVNIFADFSISAPTITDPNGGPADNLPESEVKVSGSFSQNSDANNHVTRVELWVNEREQADLEIASPTSPFDFSFYLENTQFNNFRFKLYDSFGVEVVSDINQFAVNTSAPSDAPSVSGTEVSADGLITLSATAVSNSTKYQWYEFVADACPASVDESEPIAETTLQGYSPEQKNYGANGSYCYCARAGNVNGWGPVGTGSNCALVSVAIPDTAPGATVFDTSLSLTQTQTYNLSWENYSPGARNFTLEQKIGQPGSNTNWQVLIQNVSQTTYSIETSAMRPGDVSYKISACNDDGICSAGQIITINHQVPYLHSSELINSSAKTGEIVFEGLGLDGLTQANVQIRNSAETFTLDVYKAHGDAETTYRIAAEEYLITGFENGGLRLLVSMPLGAATIEFNNSGSSDRAQIDLINARPTVSEDGIIYVSSEQSVHALDDDGSNLPGWPFSLPSDASTDDRFEAAPTLDKDVNANDLVYVGATNRYVYKLDYQANVLWQKRIRGEIHAKVQLLEEPSSGSSDQIDKLLYVGTVANGGNDISGLYALDAETGAERFMYPLLAGVKQEPLVFSDGYLHVITEDDQLHIIDRVNLSPYALRWDDIDSSLIQESLDAIVDWQIPENADVPLNSLAGLFFGLLGRAPTEAELTFFAYAYWSGISTNEITAAFLGSDTGSARFNSTLSDSQYVDSLFSYLFPSNPTKTEAGGLTRINWADELRNGVARSEVAYRLVQTDDYYSYSANAIALATAVFYDHCNCNEYTDSDGDGVTDVIELELGYNPLDPQDLMLDVPSLVATTEVLGDFDLQWQTISSPDSSLNVYYQIIESVNGQPSSVISEAHSSTVYSIVNPIGSYDYQVKACIHEQICSGWSNSVNVSVSDSIAEASVQPEAAPSSAASFKVPTDAEIEASAQFGVTAGQFRVDESGAATYQLGFNLPAGIAKVQPQLGIGYSSHAPEGIIGVGWSLQGLESIRRCGSNKLLDGFNKPVVFDSSDNFCINGQRLLLVSGVQGDAGSTYTTEINNQQIITYTAEDTFEIVGKDKSLSVFGASADSKQILPSQTLTNTWLLSYTQDNLRQTANQIDYFYTAGVGDDEILLSEVRYSGNTVSFSYDNSGRVRSSGYIKGDRISQQSSLTGVTIKNHNDVVVRTYSLELETNEIGQFELNSIIECGIGGVCKQPVVFSYRDVFTQDEYDHSRRETLVTAEGEYLRQSLVMDTNNDGMSELVTLTQLDFNSGKLCIGPVSNPTFSCRSYAVEDNLDNEMRLVPTDPDGDGFANFLLNTDNDKYDGEWIQYNVQANGTLSARTTPPLGTSDLTLSSNIKPMDFNGDGYNDLVEVKGGNDSVWVRLWSKDDNRYLAAIQVLLKEPTLADLEILAGWQSVDVNNDQLADIMVWGANDDDEDNNPHGTNLYFFTVDQTLETSTDYRCLQNQGVSNCSSSNYNADLYAKINVTGKHATPLDFNGDGSTDIVTYDTDADKWRYDLNTGDGFTRSFDIDPDGNLSSSVAPIVTDLDRDGRVELVFHDDSDSKWYRYEWSHNEEKINPLYYGGFERQALAFSDWSFSPPTDEPTAPNYDPDKVEYGVFADADNDGLMDFLYKHHQTAANTAYSLNFYHGGSRVLHAGLLDTVTTGTGLTTRIHYKLMNDSEVYTKATGLPEGMVEQDATFRVLNIVGVGSLVSSVETDVPVENGIDQVSVSYHYHGARTQVFRGSLGYESITTITEKDDISFTTTSRYSQVHPLLGKPLSTDQWAGDTLMSSAHNRYSVAETELTGGYTQYITYQQESKECQANADTVVGTVVTASSFNCSQLINVQDEYANVISTYNGYYDITDVSTFVEMDEAFTESLLDDSIKNVVISNAYGTTSDEQRYGRLSSSNAIHTRGDVSRTRTSTFEYYANGMLYSETIEPSGDCNTKLITDYVYDSYGNLISKIAHNDDSCDDNYVSSSEFSEYDFDGRYVKRSYKNGILTAEVASRNELGNVIAVVNVDGVTTQKVYDAFGAEVASYSPSGTQGYVLNQACDESVSNCYSMQVTYANGVKLKKEYADRAGQIYKSSTMNVLGNWQNALQFYDKYGRVVSAQAPGMQAVSTDYDAFDRTILIEDPNSGLTSSFTFTGRENSNSLSGDLSGGTQTQTTTYNALGEKYQVEDEIGNILTYTYEVFGELATVHSSADEAIISRLEYDDLGRKIVMQDHNVGTVSYVYDALGRLTEQTDARGVVTETIYDNLGRKTEQHVAATADTQAESMYWVYGTTEADKHRLLYEHTGNWRRDVFYDYLGRPTASLTNLDGSTECHSKVAYNSTVGDLRITDSVLEDPISSRCVIQQTFYDEYGRVFQQYDDYRRNSDGSFIEARGIRSHYQHNQVIRQQEAREGIAGRNYHEITEINEAGKVIGYLKGTQRMTLSYDDANRLSGIISGSGNYTIQNDQYSFDSLGNLTSRHLTTDSEQVFEYDGLNRITHVDGLRQYNYHNNGNLIEKDGWTLDYSDISKPIHAVGSRSNGTETETYGYDAAGNQIWTLKNGTRTRELTYSGRSKVTEIIVGSDITTFNYDANNKRFKRTDNDGTVFYVGNLELTIKGHPADVANSPDVYIKRYMGEAMQTYYPNGNAMVRWLYKDHLGSVVAITNDAGELVKRFRYDVFGKRSEIVPTATDSVFYETSLASMFVLAEISDSTRGFTGHEHVDNADIIHMNGRIYDPTLGRFLQADPFIQAPKNSQNYNRYSYVLNNPLSYTDPSGYFFKKLFKFVKKYWRTIAAIVISVYLPGASFLAGYSTATVGAITGFVSGAVASGSLKGALIGAFTGGLFGELHNMAQGFDKVLAHGAVGGIGSVLSGGKFGHGFLAAGLTQSLGGKIDAIKTKLGRVVAAAALGGTVSKLTGGKFANGALTAAFSRALNHENPGVTEESEGTPFDWVKPLDEGYPHSIISDSVMALDTDLVVDAEKGTGYYSQKLGVSGEEYARDHLRSQGYEVYSGNVTVFVGDEIRYVDVAYRSPGDSNWRFMEVKVNGSMPTQRQVRLDRQMLRTGVSNVGYNAPVGIQLNQPIRMEMMRIINPSFRPQPRHLR